MTENQTPTVEAKLAQIEERDPESHIRTAVEKLTALGFVAHDPKTLSGNYVRCSYQGTRNVSVYVHKGDVEFASKADRDHFTGLSGAKVTPRGVIFPTLTQQGMNDMLRAAKAQIAAADKAKPAEAAKKATAKAPAKKAPAKATAKAPAKSSSRPAKNAAKAAAKKAAAADAS